MTDRLALAFTDNPFQPFQGWAYQRPPRPFGGWPHLTNRNAWERLVSGHPLGPGEGFHGSCLCSYCITKSWSEGNFPYEETRIVIQAFRWFRRTLMAREAWRARDAAEAHERALALLREHLTPEQISMMERYHFFEVEVEDSYLCRRLFRIYTGTTVGNIRMVEPYSMAFCIVPVDPNPLPDHFLSQLLWLKYNFEEFLSVAIPV